MRISMVSYFSEQHSVAAARTWLKLCFVSADWGSVRKRSVTNAPKGSKRLRKAPRVGSNLLSCRSCELSLSLSLVPNEKRKMARFSEARKRLASDAEHDCTRAFSARSTH